MATAIIDREFPGGNIQVVSSAGHTTELDVELRDTTTDWFYWYFKARFPEPGEYDFRFVRPNKIGTRGPAVSSDDGRNWRWFSTAAYANTREFRWHCETAGEEVRFCMGIPYLEQNLNAFLSEFASDPHLQTETLCRSRRGRQVELVRIQEGEPRFKLLLSARHHAGEMMASHALEGILRSILADTPFGRTFRSRIAVWAVPFVDKDGVEDGDQGKNRDPHDHARDYQETGIYPETTAIRELLNRVRPEFVLDLHCPWIRGGDYNECSYMVGVGNPYCDRQMERFGRLLEQEAPPEAPYFAANNIPFGTAWNTGNNYTQGKTIKHYAVTLPTTRCAQTLEIPFANFGDVTVTPDSMHLYGAAIARAILRYLDEEAEEQH